jgi:transposase
MTKGHVRLSPPERRVLKAKARSRRVRMDEVRRADLILGLAAGESYTALQRRLGCGRQYVARWKRRFLAERIAGLYSRHRGRKALRRTPALAGKILAATRVAPVDGTTHWSTRRLARHLRVSHSMVARVWQRAGLQPHRMRHYMASNDPDFEQKAADIIGLYHKPPAHAAVFSLDEKSAIQALDRLDPVLPLSPGRAERHGFEYFRHGTLSLYAALNTATGEVLGKTTTRHTSAEFIAFLEELLASQPAPRQVHLILDNLSAHKTKAVAAFLGQHRRLHLHYTPTYSSWLNQVEIWFSKIQRDLIARGVFTSKSNLARKIMRYIRLYNKNARPIKWAYRDPSYSVKTSLDLSDTLH